ncbi:unnamed protein product [Prunus armeniaca]
MTKGLKMIVKTLNFMIVLITKVKMNNACWKRMNVDHNAPDIDPTANEGEKSDDMAISDVNNLDNSSCDEVELPMRKKEEKTTQV